MKFIIIIVLSLLFINANAQDGVIDLIENVSKTTRSIEYKTAVNQLRFNCTKVDTVEGIEVEMFYNKDELSCLYYRFFVETVDTAITNANMLQWLFKHHDKYSYLGGGSTSFTELCDFFDNTDSFLFCNNMHSYDKLNYPYRDIYSDEVYYTKGKKIYFMLNFVKATAYRFESADTSYANFYQHFSINKPSDKINLIRYKEVYKRDKCLNKVAFGNPLGSKRKHGHFKLNCVIYSD